MLNCQVYQPLATKFTCERQLLIQDIVGPAVVFIQEETWSGQIGP